MARHGPLVRCRVDPGRSRLQLLPLPVIDPATVAVAIHLSHTYVPRRPYCTQSHSHSYPHRETRLHAHAWRPTSPVCTATSHTLSLSSHTVAHSLVPHLHTPHCSHPRGHSPAVFHLLVGVRTRVPPPARTWFLPPAVPLSRTACWEARTPAHSSTHHSHTGSHSYSGALPHTGIHSHTRALLHTGFHSGSLSHTPFYSRYACVAARISTHW